MRVAGSGRERENPGMPTTPEHLRDLMFRFGRGPLLVREAISGLDAGALNRRPVGSDWSIRDIIIHLADAEIVGAMRLRLVIANDAPAIEPWEEGPWKRRLHYLWRDPEAALALFELLVYTNGELLQQCDAQSWKRTGVHPERGVITLEDLLQDRVTHSEEHIAQIREYREGR